MSLGLNYKIIKQTECAKVYRLLQVVLHVSIKHNYNAITVR